MTIPPELACACEAEEFFEALGVEFRPAVLAAHRLGIMKVFGVASVEWLEANPAASAGARREALARMLREAHETFEGEASPAEPSPFAPRLVRIGRRA